MYQFDILDGALQTEESHDTCTHLVLVGEATPVVPELLTRCDVHGDHTIKVAGEDDASGPSALLRLLPPTALQHTEQSI